MSFKDQLKQIDSMRKDYPQAFKTTIIAAYVFGVVFVGFMVWLF